MNKSIPISPMHVASRIRLVRGHKVLLDVDLADLYGVPTKRLNEQVKRNAARFPQDFMFRLSVKETEEMNRSQIATGLQKHRDPRYPPYAFTEHGALMAANMLNSPRADEVSVFVVRAFVQLRDALGQHKDLAVKLEDLERKVQALALRQDALSSETRMQLRQVFEAIRELMAPPRPSKKPAIGFVRPKE